MQKMTVIVMGSGGIIPALFWIMRGSNVLCDFPASGLLQDFHDTSNMMFFLDLQKP